MIRLASALRALCRPLLRSSMSPIVFSLLLSAYLTFFANCAFWYSMVGITTTYVIKAQIGVLLFIANFCLCSVLCLPYILKAAAVLLLFISVTADYYIVNYGIMLDKSMMLNVFHTDIREVWELLTWNVVLIVLVKVIIPAVALCIVRIKWPKLCVKAIILYLFRPIIALIIAVTICIPNSKDVVGFGRENWQDSKLSFKVIPFNMISASYGILNAKLRSERKPFFCNESHVANVVNKSKPTTFVFIVGESVNSGHLSINGYDRETTPLLATVPDLVSLKDVASCGTSTAISVPCMFSKFGKDEFDANDSDNIANLLDVASKAGFDTRWYENNGSSYGVATRHQFHKFVQDRMYDAELINVLEDLKVDMKKKDMFIVLHTIGSHGPAYYERAPEQFWKFSPICKIHNFLSCTREKVVNSYDNTIVYLDFFIFNMIKFLQNADSNVALIYVSDHGESLGEMGIYLHGLPFIAAPKEQRQVPMIVWVSDRFAASHKIDKNCVLRNKHSKSKSISHDNVFHTVLGLLRIDTQDKKNDLDVFYECER